MRLMWLGVWQSSQEQRLGRGYPGLMNREDALAAIELRRASDPDGRLLAIERDGEWMVARIGVDPSRPTGTATKPPPVGLRDDPHSAVEHTASLAGIGG